MMEENKKIDEETIINADNDKEDTTNVDANADTNTDANADTNADVKVDTNAYTNADTNANANADTNADANADTNANADVNVDTNETVNKANQVDAVQNSAEVTSTSTMQPKKQVLSNKLIWLAAGIVAIGIIVVLSIVMSKNKKGASSPEDLSERLISCVEKQDYKALTKLYDISYLEKYDADVEKECVVAIEEFDFIGKIEDFKIKDTETRDVKLKDESIKITKAVCKIKGEDYSGIVELEIRSKEDDGRYYLRSVTVSSEGEIDHNTADKIKTAFESTLANENAYDEVYYLIKKSGGFVFLVTDIFDSSNVMYDITVAKEMRANLGAYNDFNKEEEIEKYKVKYGEHAGESFCVLVDNNWKIYVYAGTNSDAELAPSWKYNKDK